MRKQLSPQAPELQTRDWPPVPEFKTYPDEFSDFLYCSLAEQRSQLVRLKSAPTNEFGAFLNRGLSEIYAYVYGYVDSSCYLSTQPELEIALQRAKILLEEAYVCEWLPIATPPQFSHVEDGYAYLSNYIEENSGVGHDLYTYLRDEASLFAIKEFLRLEVCRNEVVDDEIALLICGLQGNLKRTIAANLWDECGNGDLTGFHTYWLRRLVEHANDWDDLIVYRQTRKPWFSSITSNTFNVLLTRPGYKYRAYGCFTTTEAWVAPHFEAILQGLLRTGFSHPDIDIYFRAHCKIDPFHTVELLDGIKGQIPTLSVRDMQEIVMGAHAAVAAGVSQYRLVMEHLRSIDKEANT
jgi:hypothetical protein